jgi:hypothetical protein
VGEEPVKTVLPVFALRVLAVFCTFAFLACDKSPTGPEPVKDPRTYTWTIDTLAYPGSFQTAMRDIWGSSPSDVYVVGHNDRGFGKMFHYDGKQWKPVGLNAVEGGAIEGPIDLSSIYGFASNDIWAVGERIYANWAPPPNFLDSSLIIHFDGAKWLEFKVSTGSLLQAVWGSMPNDVWAGGIEGTVFHFDGSTWTRVQANQDVWFNAFAGSSGETYALAYQLDVGIEDTTWHYCLSWDGRQWNVTHSYVEVVGYTPTFGNASLALIGAQMYSSGYGIFRRSSSRWEKIFEDPGGAFFRRVYGTSGSNIFAVGGFRTGMVYHFNGQDWSRFEQFNLPGYHFDAVWSDGREVFIVGNNNQQTLVLHGR